jgi:hypothetical protein
MKISKEKIGVNRSTFLECNKKKYFEEESACVH